MNDLSFDYSFLNPEIVDKSYLSYQTSRGCPYNCRFCNIHPVHGRKYRIRSIHKVINDIKNMEKLKQLDIIDENFFIGLQRPKAFADLLLQNKINIRWHAMARADYFRDTNVDFWKLMKKSGCRIILVGGESGSQRVLDSMKKNYRVDDIINCTEQLNKADIQGSFSFISGIPGEEREDIEKTISLIDKLKNKSSNAIFLFIPFPNTDYYHELKKKIKFPENLRGWGSFLWGSKKYLKWHPHKELAFRLTYVARWLEKPPLKRILDPLKKLDLPLFVVYVCGFISHYRWKHKFYNFPLDIYVQYWINKYVFKYLWWK